MYFKSILYTRKHFEKLQNLPLFWPKNLKFVLKFSQTNAYNDVANTCVKNRYYGSTAANKFTTNDFEALDTSFKDKKFIKCINLFDSYVLKINPSCSPANEVCSC